MYFTDSNVAKDDLDGFKMKIRYIFVFLGPKGQFSYLEIGRCMGNLMNNHDFKAAIYRAKTSHELIHSITNYANNSLCLVLPTGEFNAELLKTMSDWVHKKMKKEDKNYQKPKRRALGEDRNVTEELAGSRESLENCRPDPFKPSHRLFGNMISETKFRYGQYWSDIRDGLSWKCVIASVFIFSICLAPTLTFGGVLGRSCFKGFLLYACLSGV